MRRVYRRRADTLVFTTLAVIIIAVIGVYYELRQDPPRPSAAGDGPEGPTERLLVLAVPSGGGLELQPEDLEAMPRLVTALEEARATGSAHVTDPVVIDTVWYQLQDAYGVVPHLTLAVTYEGGHYRLQMVR